MGIDRTTTQTNAFEHGLDLRSDQRQITLARIGDRLSAQRVELFSFNDDHAVRLERWLALDVAFHAQEMDRIPLTWFPWSMGSVRPAEYLFVRNAGLLPMTTPPLLIGADLSIGAALMVPLIEGITSIGAVCVYWREERSSWPTEDRDDVVGWAFQALRPNR